MTDEKTVKIEARGKEVEMAEKTFIDMVVEYNRSDKSSRNIAHKITHKLGLADKFSELYEIVWCPFKKSEDGHIGDNYYRKINEGDE